MERGTGQKVKRIHIGNKRVFQDTSKDLKKKGIMLTTSKLQSPYSYGLDEQMNCTHMDKSRAMLENADRPCRY